MRRWIVVANAGQARIYSLADDLPALRLVHQIRLSKRPRQKRPGRPAGGGRRSGTPDGAARLGVERLEGLAAAVAELLQRARDDDAFDEVAVCAAPALLAMLQTAAADAVGAALRVALPHDCPCTSADDCCARIRRELNHWFSTPSPASGTTEAWTSDRTVQRRVLLSTAVL